MKEESKHGGKRKGSGRPSGGMNEETILRIRAEAEYKKRVTNVTDELLNAQLTIALGESYLIRVDEVGEGKKKKRKHVTVESEQEILAYFNKETDLDNYYYVTTKKPDSRALNDVLDRTYGRAKQTIDNNLTLPGSNDVDEDEVDKIITKVDVISRVKQRRTTKEV